MASRTQRIVGHVHAGLLTPQVVASKPAAAAKFNETVPRGNHTTMRVIGVQSGNAVDGLDVGIFDFEPVERSPLDPRALKQSIKYTTVANKTFPFSAERRKYVLALRAMNHADGKEYAKANYLMGEWFSDAVNTLLTESGVDRSSIHLIGSHGQTIAGHPHWEIGDPSVIAQRTGITVAADFRTADVGAGGNGTPCTCTYDSIMLRPPAGSKNWRIAINIGGTSSMTFLPPWPTLGDAASEAHVPTGLDPGLGVFFMDLCVREIDPSLEYDDNGNIARSGKVQGQLLQRFLANKYYQQKALPIGVGPDDFPEKLFHEWHGWAKELGINDVDFLCTLVELTATQLALAAKRFGGPNVTGGKPVDVLMRGGVMRNSYFVERVRVQMAAHLEVAVERISTLEDLCIDEESWEQAMYALFGYLCFNNVYNFVPSCTGASRPVVGGKISPGENFHSVRLLNCAT